MQQQMEERRIDTEEIRRKHPLADFLESNLGIQGKYRGNYVTFSACPSCGQSKDPKSTRISVRQDTWKCFSCDDRGDVIRAAEKLWGMTFLEAAKELGGESTIVRSHTPRPIDRSAETAKAKANADLMRAVFKKLHAACQPYRDQEDVLRYLVDERRLPLPIVRQAQQRGMVGFLPTDPSMAKKVLVDAVGEQLLHQSGLWKPDKKLPGVAYRPLVFFLPGGSSAEFRLIGKIQEGWNKSIRYGPLEYPYWWLGTAHQALIVEGLIDVLSAVALGFNGHILGLPGCSSVRSDWFEAASKRYQIRRWIIGTDNDLGKENGKNPGQEWALNISELLTELDLPNYIHPPKAGDINDELRARYATAHVK